jgi:hypothetical protein
MESSHAIVSQDLQHYRQPPNSLNQHVKTRYADNLFSQITNIHIGRGGASGNKFRMTLGLPVGAVMVSHHQSKL